MLKTKKYIEQLIKKEQLVKIPLWNSNKKVNIKRYNSISNKYKLNLIYSAKFKTYAVIDEQLDYKINNLFYMVKKDNSDLTVGYKKDLIDRVNKLYPI